ncbi:ras gtpase-activating protein [Anaeramoeba flamelloides]|uniref:Ras gtpase-activating protein n=1 Tax=Anaeramoeba flamelloides TaxID=1746091 RepID=A0ABQ8Y820_9EUKA|nr:ras gtpase-activating protein [Anaeramoeba flamelloides]
MSGLPQEIYDLLGRFQSLPSINILQMNQENLKEIPIIQVFLRWVNHHFQKSGVNYKIPNFSKLSDLYNLTKFLEQYFPKIDFFPIFLETKKSEQAKKLSEILSQTQFKNVVPKPEDFHKGDEIALLKFFLYLALKDPILNQNQNTNGQNNYSTNQFNNQSIPNYPTNQTMNSQLSNNKQENELFGKKKIEELTSLIEKNEKTQSLLQETENNVLKLKNELETELNEYTQLRENQQQTQNTSETIQVLNYQTFSDQTENFIQLFSILKDKIALLCKIIPETFSLKERILLKGMLQTLYNGISDIYITSKKPEEILIQALFDLFKKNGIKDIPESLFHTIKFQIFSVQLADLQGVLDSCSFILNKLAEKKLFPSNKKKVKASIRNLFIYFVFVKSFKNKFSQTLINEFLIPNNVINIGEEFIQNLTVDIIEIFNNYITGYIDFEKLKTAFGLFIKSLGFQSYKTISSGLINLAKKQALGETLRYILLNILTNKEIVWLKKSLEPFSEIDNNIENKKELYFQGIEYLKNELNYSDIIFINAIIDPNNAGGKIQKIYTNLFHFSESIGFTLSIIKMAICQEVQRTPRAGSLFRANNVATKMITQYSLVYGQEFLKELLNPTIKELCKTNLFFETDPSRIDEGDDEEEKCNEGMKNLKTWFHTLCDSIFKGMKYAPVGFRIITNTLKSEVKKKFPDNVISSVGGFIFLRFLCPAIVSPQYYNLIDEEPTKNAKRGLLLLSTVVQALSNGITFSSNRFHMQPINGDIVSRFEERKNCLIELSNEKILSSILEKQNKQNINIEKKIRIDQKDFIFNLNFQDSDSPYFLKLNSNKQEIETNEFTKQLKDLIEILIINGKNKSNKDFLNENQLMAIKRTNEKSEKLILLLNNFQKLFTTIESFYQGLEKEKTIYDLTIKQKKDLKKKKKLEKMKSSKNGQSTLKLTPEEHWVHLENVPPIKEGIFSSNFLLENGKKTKWKKTKFTIKETFLAISQKPFNQIQEVMVINADIRISPSDRTIKKKNSFTIKRHTDKKTRCVICNKTEERDNWVEIIRDIRKKVNN